VSRPRHAKTHAPYKVKNRGYYRTNAIHTEFGLVYLWLIELRKGIYGYLQVYTGIDSSIVVSFN
jgi:hypothetical protein